MLKKKIAAVLAMAALCAQPVFAQNINVFVNDNLVSFSNQEPVIVDGRTLIPLRGVFENLGYNVEWEPNTKTAILTNGRYYICIQVDSPYLSVNRQPKELDVPAQIINNSMMIPLRAVSEGTGISVEWDAATKSAKINSGSTANTTVTPDTTDLGNLTINDLDAVSKYMDGYVNAIEPIYDVLDSFQSSAMSGDIEQMKSAFSALKTSSATARTALNELNPPDSCSTIHSLSIEMLDLLDEFSTFTLQRLENPENITSADLTKLQEYTTKADELKSKMDAELQKWQDLANSFQ